MTTRCCLGALAALLLGCPPQNGPSKTPATGRRDLPATGPSRPATSPSAAAAPGEPRPAAGHARAGAPAPTGGRGAAGGAAAGVRPRSRPRGLPLPAAGLIGRPQPVKPCTGPRPRDAVICVDGAFAGKGKGSATAPFATIGQAIAAARSGALIQVAEGVYRENVKIEGKTLTLRGGFAGSAASPPFGERRPARRRTAIHGQGGDAAVALLRAGSSRVEGFVISRGTGSERQKEDFYLGGGIYVSGGKPTIARNLIEGNDIVTPHPHNNEENQGAGIFAEGATVTIVGNVIRKNHTGRGALAVADCRARIEGNHVVGNLAIGDHGGGLYLAGPRIHVIGNFIADNTLRPKSGEGGWGGGILVLNKGTRAELSGNVVTGNSAPEIGSGVFIDDGAEATLKNELIVANRCSTHGAGIYVDGLDRRVKSLATLINVTVAAHACAGNGNALYLERAKVRVKNSIFWGNGGDDFFADKWSSLAVSHTLSQQRMRGAGNSSKDPLFVDARRRDFRLRPGSPAIDAGDPADPPGAEPAPNGGRVNLGAFGGTAEARASPP